VIGFHTFDYARHFLSCCSRMLGLEHKTSRGSIIMEYYGRDVAIKIMPTGVNPDRWLSACSWADTQWRIGELRAEYKDKMVLIGVDDMDVFKGIELKLAAFQEVLVHHPEWRGKLVLIQVRDVWDGAAMGRRDGARGPRATRRRVRRVTIFARCRRSSPDPTATPPNPFPYLSSPPEKREKSDDHHDNHHDR